MNRRNATSVWLKPARSWLAGALAILLLVLAVGAGAHREHREDTGRHGHHECAACLIAHGGLLADGTTGAFVVFSAFSFDLPGFCEMQPALVLDLRLSPGRAPPA